MNDPTTDPVERIVLTAWHEYRYPRPATDEPTDAFRRAIRVALTEVGAVPGTPAATAPKVIDVLAIAREAAARGAALSPAPGNKPDREWRPMDEAPHDGTEILGWYGPDEIVRIRWAEERRCMLASVAPGAGLFGPGWECVAESLIVEDPLKWRAASVAQEGGDRG